MHRKKHDIRAVCAKYWELPQDFVVNFVHKCSEMAKINDINNEISFLVITIRETYPLKNSFTKIKEFGARLAKIKDTVHASLIGGGHFSLEKTDRKIQLPNHLQG